MPGSAMGRPRSTGTVRDAGAPAAAVSVDASGTMRRRRPWSAAAVPPSATAQQQQQHLVEAPRHKLHSKRSPLPAKHNKSSLDSSEDPQRPQMHSAAIAIEIDAATVTENNSSTATSNFPYKVASEGGGAPMNLLPLCEKHRQRRRASLNSNTTIETDELSRDEEPEDEEQLTPSTCAVQPSSSSSSTARAFAGAAPPRNECVRIKRKRFVPDAMQDYCSSCSRCSSCSCDQARTSSCSSLDEDLAHELTVAADCHRCMAAEQQAGHSRPGSSLKSFCSCHTNSCCCARESFCTAADHTIVSTPTHSSTLTPLSTQQEQTMTEQDLNAITDADASSLSQSAEYFSLSSAVGGSKVAEEQASSSCGYNENNANKPVSLVAWPAIDVNALLQQTIRKTAAVLQEATPVKRRMPLTPQLPRPGVPAPPGSNDSSSATLTPSIISVKQPTAVTTRNGITNTSTLPAVRTLRGGKYSPVTDPLQRRSQEIIL
ncbi:uncharacterized protein LOC115759983 [Drosophila novamexicana]|uniref:uncharacterized protein LOC115759983 n=1 Tax=Drosophila novamexicana TaxID=47314 RepID=UPI0011E59AAC|nr:uncharacterized protein LOC115759983 [Drosophila novamexicana]